MILAFLCMIVFSIAYLVKGGQFNKYLDKLPKLFGGKFFSALIIFIFCSSVSSDWIHGLIFCVAWLLAVTPSMGEEAGAIGRWRFWWGDYKDAVYSATFPAHKKAGMPVFDRRYGILKGMQRGAWMGAVFTVAGATSSYIVGETITISNVFPIPIMALGFPLAHFIGQEIYWRIHGTDNWKYSEAMVAFLLGLSYFIYH